MIGINHMKACKVCNQGRIRILSQPIRSLFFVKCLNPRCSAEYEIRLSLGNISPVKQPKRSSRSSFYNNADGLDVMYE